MLQFWKIKLNIIINCCISSANHNCPKSNHTHLVMSESELTRGTVIHEGTEGLAIPPVLVKVVNRQLWYLVLNPAQQPLFGSEFLNIFIVLIIPHGHGDGVMENECPDETQNQLQVPIYNSFAVCTGPRQSKGNWVSKWTNSWYNTVLLLYIHHYIQWQPLVTASDFLYKQL